MARATRKLTGIISAFPRFLARYFGWIAITAVVTLTGGTLVMLFKEWSLATLLVSQLVWPRLMLAMLIAIPIALFPIGRFYVLSAVVGGLAYTVLLMLV